MWLQTALPAALFVVLVWLEHRRPLRRAVESTRSRIGRNLCVAVLSAAAVQLAELPLVVPLAALVERRRWGLLGQAALPGWVALPVAVALMDYTLYAWHVLTHRVPWLWRFHVVHHVDLDMDASTALRFHFAELLISVPWRAGQVVLIGVSPGALAVWQTVLLLCILFHHSNLRLPIAVERRLVRVLVTPRMHGIHHSIVPEETNANWSSGLTLWDRLHGTLRLNVPQEAVTIGVPAYRRPEEVRLAAMLALPFRPQPPAWTLPDDGTPARVPLPTPADHLVA